MLSKHRDDVFACPLPPPQWHVGIGNHEWQDTPGYDFMAVKARFRMPTVNGVPELYYSMNREYRCYIICSWA